ncbi:hypothetical protein GCM10011348_43010 [Marinobacterium nitratireducens]|uniref:Uncharacterized protein n=1 Tax=Marinobacterium nitratireducens TaxID=518897 RepID=A0A917ZPR1_9GAMM|nr:hypothetical protein [Marinobacterium nitratireducens]GGO88154.1 hypothetical protein GCM10011348_43010 [Marinobacterium nitratireducens]
MLHIASFTFQYDQHEDRIRLIGNLNNGQPRIDFWVTRRLCLRILSASDQLVSKTSERVSNSPSEHREAMAQFEHEQARQAMKVQEAPLETRDKALLLHRLDASFRDGRYLLSFFAGEGDGAVATSVLNYAELHQVIHLLHRGCQVLDWGAPKMLFGTPNEPTPRLQ